MFWLDILPSECVSLYRNLSLPQTRTISSTASGRLVFTRSNAAEGVQVGEGSKTEAAGVKETLSPSMNILVSSNFERLLWFIAYDVYGSTGKGIQEARQAAGMKVKEWQMELKTKGAFSVEKKVLDAANADFTSERVSDNETVATIHEIYGWSNTPGSKGYILDPHSAIGMTAALRLSKAATGVHIVALSTAHPAKFSHAVKLALVEEKGFKFNDIIPSQFVGMEDLPRRLRYIRKSGGLDSVRAIIVEEVEKEKNRTYV